MALSDLFSPHVSHAPAVTCGPDTLTFGQLRAGVDAIAYALLAAGISPGEPIALQLPNSVTFPLVFHGILRAGAIAVPIPHYAHPQDVAATLRTAGARILITEHVNPLLPPATTDLRGFVDTIRSQLGCHSSVGDTSRTLPRVSPDAVAALPQSSGTTGTPKLVELTHSNLESNTRQFAAAVPITASDVVLSPLPLSHIYGLTATLNVPLAVGAHVVTMPFEADAFLTAHTNHQVGVTFIAPPLAPLLASAPDDIDFSALHHVVSGAAALDPRHGRAVEERTGARVLQGYGMTEASPVTHLSRADTTPIDAIGTPLQGTEHAIIDPVTGLEVPEGGIGELVVRGPQVMRGYVGAPDDTAQVLRDGWLHTGDLGQLLPDGSVRLQGRLKDIITSHGVQVSPTKVEQRLAAHPEVDDVAVFRSRTLRGEECPAVAFVGTLSASELLRFARQKLNPYERPRAAYAVDTIPRSGAGKILRGELAARFPTV